MNKKFSTLMASLLMASSFSVVAEGSTPENGHYEFRRGKVLSNVTFGEVKAIDAQKWYQLRAKDPKTGREGYLVHSRNQETGEVFLRLVEDVEGAQKTPLLASLWQIDYGNTDGLSGGKYRFINKETKVSLMYDYAFAIDAEGKSIDKPRASQMIDGCVTRWAWYQGNSQDINFEFTAPYAYFNNKKDSVMIMKANEKGFITSYKDIDEHILANGVVKDREALQVKPVLANSIVLNAYDFNSMIDYNKKSVFDEGKAFGSFKFYTPDGKLFYDGKWVDPNERPFKGEAMLDGMNYKAENSKLQEDFFFESYEELGGKDLGNLPGRIWVKSEEVLRLETENTSLLSSNEDLDAELFALQQQVEYNKGLLDGGLESDYNEVVTKQNELVTTIAGYDEKVLAIDVERRTTSYETLYKKYQTSIAKYNNNEDASSAYKLANNVYTAFSNLLSNGFQGSGKKLDALKTEFNALEKLDSNDKKIFNQYFSIVGQNEENAESISELAETISQNEQTIEDNNATIRTLNSEIESLQISLNKNNLAAAKSSYLLDNTFLRLNYIDNKKNNQYLMVDTAYWQSVSNPVDGDLKIVNKVPNRKDDLAIQARYYFKFTYYPSQDSLVVEPLNASDISEKEAEEGISFKDSYAGDHFVYANDVNNKASQVSNTWTSYQKWVSTDGWSYEGQEGDEIVIRLKDLSTSKWCLTATSKNKGVDASPLNARIAFDNPYDYLVRTTLEPGLYWIQSTVKNGKYLVAGLNGQYMYDVPNTDQDYGMMPATMYVVEKYGSSCSDLVQIRNREYGEEWYTTFKGQLYAAVNAKGEEVGKYTIDMTKYDEEPTTELEAWNCGLWMKDTYKFPHVDNEEALTSQYHGYRFLDPETLRYTNYAMRYNRYNNDSEYINQGEGDVLFASEGDNTYFEFDTVYYQPGYTEGKRNYMNISVNEFGYGAGVIDAISGKELPQLIRQAYTMKVKDVNLIDNDTVYVNVNEKFGEKNYYMTRGIGDILDNGLGTMSLFYLKADQIDSQSDTCYALINTVNTPVYPYLYNGYGRVDVLSTGQLGEADLYNGQEDNIDAFALAVSNRPLYRSIPEGKVNFYRTVGGVDQKLFADEFNETGAPASNVIEGFEYLGLSQEAMNVGDTSKVFFVEPLRLDNKLRMPQYMLALTKDTVADGFWCINNVHGYFADKDAAEAEDASHYAFYNGYTAGRFLVNLTDSLVKEGDGSHAYHKPDLFTYKGYAVRLGFVEGVHMVITKEHAAEINAAINTYMKKEVNWVKEGEFFYTFKGDNTLESMKVYVKRYDKSYLDPIKFFNPENTKRNDYSIVDRHNNWSFSFRLVQDATEEESEEFLIESNLDGVSEIASWQGSWIKIYDKCPVTNYIGGNHGELLLGKGLYADNVTDGTLFKVTTTTDSATANEAISAGNVVVAGTNGAVVVKGAEGKNVIVSTILGKVVANETVSSDNVTIAAPQGVVVVSVDGESFKVVVK